MAESTPEPAFARKPIFRQLLELQREYLQLRWDAIKARGEQAFYSKNVDTHVVTYALSRGATDEESHEVDTTRHNLPAHAASASATLTTGFLFIDAATCGLYSRRRKFTDFGDGMVSYNDVNGAYAALTDPSCGALIPNPARSSS